VDATNFENVVACRYMAIWFGATGVVGFYPKLQQQQIWW